MKIEQAEQLRNRIRMAIVERIQSVDNSADNITKFIEDLTEELQQITLDEIQYRKWRK